MAYPPIEEEFHQALSIFLEVYRRTCTAAIATNDFDIYQQNPETTQHLRAESKIHEKTLHSIDAIRKSTDGEYSFEFRGKIINELMGK